MFVMSGLGWQSLSGLTCDKAKTLSISLAEVSTLHRIVVGRNFKLRWRYERENVGVVTARTFLEHICPAVGCPGRHSRRPSPGWCRRSIGESRNCKVVLKWNSTLRTMVVVISSSISCWLLLHIPFLQQKQPTRLQTEKRRVWKFPSFTLQVLTLTFTIFLSLKMFLLDSRWKCLY